VPTRLRRALDLAEHNVRLPGTPDDDLVLQPGAPPTVRRSTDGDRAELHLVGNHPGPEQWLYLGTLAERIRIACWSEDLSAHVTVTSAPRLTLQITAHPRRPL
jgi:hypothetical protein